MNKLPALLVATLLIAPNTYATDNTTESNGDKGLPLMILGLVAKPFLDNMVGKFYTWFGQKTGIPATNPLVANCGEGCTNNFQDSNTTTNQSTNNNPANSAQNAFGMAIGAWVKPPRMPAGEADLTQPQLWKKSSNGQSTEYTQVKLSILLTETGLVAVGVQDEGKPVQLRDTFMVGKPKDGAHMAWLCFRFQAKNVLMLFASNRLLPVNRYRFMFCLVRSTMTHAVQMSVKAMKNGKIYKHNCRAHRHNSTSVN